MGIFCHFSTMVVVTMYQQRSICNNLILGQTIWRVFQAINVSFTFCFLECLYLGKPLMLSNNCWLTNAVNIEI